MRVGVDTGDVVVSTLGDRGGAEFVVVGQTVNRASRLQSIAPPGGDHDLLRHPPADPRPVQHGAARGAGAQGHRRAGRRLPGRQRAAARLPARPVRRRRGGARRPPSAARSSCASCRSGCGTSSRRATGGSSPSSATPASASPGCCWSSTRGWPRARSGSTGSAAARRTPTRTARTRCCATWSASRFAIAESDTAATVRGKLEDGFVAAWEVTDDDPANARAAARLVGTWLNFDLGDLTDVADPPGMLDPMSLRNRAAEALAGYFARLSTPPAGRGAPGGPALGRRRLAELARRRRRVPAADCRVLVVGTARPTIFDDRPRWTEGLDQHVRLPLDALSRRESRLLLQQLLQHVDRPARRAPGPGHRVGRGQPVLHRGAGHLADRRRRGREGRGRRWTRRDRPGRVGAGPLDAARRAAGPPRRAQQRGARPAAAGLGRRPGVLGRRRRPAGPRLGAARRRRRLRRPSTGCAAASWSSSGRSRPSTRPASSCSSTPCCATWPTTGCCAATGSATTPGPRPGSPR